MWHVSADVRTAEDLDLPTPQLTVRGDGRRAARPELVEATGEIVDYVRNLGERAERLSGVPPEEDNMLKISGDGRAVALDIRLRLPDTQPSGRTKLDVAAVRIAGIWRDSRDLIYTDPDTAQPSLLPGALQLVFCDLGTLKGTGWNVYDELRAKLIDAGLPPQGIRFIHEARTDEEKGKLFAAARTGHVDVLLGSTAKMGVGTNVQARAIALHHLDCPWRPADLEQREGRILRQGNQNPEVSIYRYVVEGSFDAYSWQTVERKAKFIAQVMRGRLDVRELDDIGDNALSFAEVKAIAAGDPMILEKAAAETELTRLERLSRAHQNGHAVLTHTITSQTMVLHRTEDDLPPITAAAATARSTAGNAFQATIDGSTYTDRSAAADQLRQHVLHRIWATPRPQHGTDLGAVADLGGHTVLAAFPDRRPEQPPALTLSLRDVPRTDSTIETDDLSRAGIGLIRHLEHKVAALPALIADVAAGPQRRSQKRRNSWANRSSTPSSWTTPDAE